MACAVLRVTLVRASLSRLVRLMVAISTAEGANEPVNGSVLLVMVALALLVLVEDWGAKLGSDFTNGKLVLVALNVFLSGVARPRPALSPGDVLVHTDSLIGCLVTGQDLPKIVDRKLVIVF